MGVVYINGGRSKRAMSGAAARTGAFKKKIDK